MAKKNQPYTEIIDLQKELKEYKNLCEGKNSKFKYYLDWKEHITKKLVKLGDNDKNENFLHYLINQKRYRGKTDSIIMPVMVFCFSLYFNKSDLVGDVISFLILILITMSFMIIYSDECHKNYCFYCDTIEILQEIMYGKKSRTPDPLAETL